MRRIVVRRSPVHGRGVFALTNIPSGEFLVGYEGAVTSWRVASQRYQRNRAEDGHKFFFGLDGAYVIDGARGGNCCCPLIPLAVSIDHASGKNAVKLVQKGIEAEIAALDGVAFRQRADGEMFVNFASALDLPANSANVSLLDIPHNTKVS